MRSSWKYDGEQLVNYVSNNIRAKGEGRIEPFSCSLRRGGPIGKFLSVGGHQKVINNCNRLYEQSSTPKCLHKQGIITAQISYITRNIKQTNGRKKVMIHKYQVHTFPSENISRHTWPSLYWHAGSQWKLSMITQIIEGQVRHFSSWIQLTLGKVQGWWGPRHIMSRGFRGCHQIETTTRKGMARKRYSVFSVNDNP